MDQTIITFYSYLLGSTSHLLLAGIALWLWHRRILPGALSFAALASSLHQLAIASHYQWVSLHKHDLLTLELAHYGIWIFALLSYLKYFAGRGLPIKAQYGFYGIWASMLLTTLALNWIDHPLTENSGLLIWSGLLLSIIGLACVEQLLRNALHERLIKLWGISIGAIFSYDIVLFTVSIIYQQINSELWQARGAANALAGLSLIIGSLLIGAKTPPQQGKLSISRPVAFYSTSVGLAGAFLSLMALGGYYVQHFGGSWGQLLMILLLFAALLCTGMVFISRSLRLRISVWVNKHFFRHKYDYRAEWLRLINYLSRSPEVQDFHRHAITAIASIFRSPKGALWLKQGQQFTPVSRYNMQLPEHIDMSEPIDTPFCRALEEHEWVFSPYANDENRLGALNPLLPNWIYQIDDLWLILPLLTEHDLLGFMILTKPELETALTWEDLDLLKAAGRQVASYLDRHQVAEQITESRQFDAFHKLTAFIMHDLKNLIAQQALVVENAAKHKDNPAFIEDAINTIDNSVARMSNLLKKLQQNEPRELRSVDLRRILVDAVKKCQEHKPSPSLRLEVADCHVTADPDHLAMTFTHLIKNAQEATDNSGFVDVTLRMEANNAIISVEDNGTGMSSEFVRERLFRPFVTTKSGKGMGIGVYQSREFIHSLGGDIRVESQPGAGSTFTISIPAAQNHS